MDKYFAPVLENLYGMLGFITEEAASAGLEERDFQGIELAAEEALINVISYAGLDPKDEKSVCITCEPVTKDNAKKGVKIVIMDNGVPYNPLPKDVDLTSELEDRQIGGYGVFLILKLMDSVEYARGDGKNILTLVKYKA